MSPPSDVPDASGPPSSPVGSNRPRGGGSTTPARSSGGNGGGGAGSGGGGGGGGGGRSGGAGGGGGNRNRNRGRGGGGQARSGGGQARSGGGSRSGGGGGRGGSSGGGRGGSSGGRRPPSGGNRAGGGGQGQGRRPEERSAPSAVAMPAPVAVRSPENLVEEQTVRANRRRAVMACAAPSLVVAVVAGVVVTAVGLPLVGVVVLVVVAAAGTAWTWRTAPASVVRSLGARPSAEAERPRLHNLVDGLCATMGLPTPAVAVVDSPVPNALVVGRDPASATLVVTSALDSVLDLVELEGVLAHELVHVKRYDAVLSGAAVAAVAPLALVVGPERGAELVHRLIGPGREFSADRRAATVVHYPVGLGSALRTMAGATAPAGTWPPGRGRRARLTTWLWIDPGAGLAEREPVDGQLDDPVVRAAALSLL